MVNSPDCRHTYCLTAASVMSSGNRVSLHRISYKSSAFSPRSSLPSGVREENMEGAGEAMAWVVCVETVVGIDCGFLESMEERGELGLEAATKDWAAD